MSIQFWSVAGALLIVAIGFIAVPLQTGKSLLSTPKTLIVAFVPLSAVGIYALLGSPDANTIQHVANNQTTDSAEERQLGSVSSMLDGLAVRLEKEPDDADGWILLARSYQHVGQNTEALAAYEHAQALGKTDINLEASLVGGGSAEHAAAVDASALRGRVALSPNAAAIVQPGDTLFIFAKESRDHRMPVVALRKSVTELPFEFVLTDKEVMVPGSQLSNYEQLIITAKISRSGNATDNTLGLEAWSDAISPASAERIDLIIGNSDE